MSATSLTFTSTKTGILPNRLGPYAEVDRTDDEFDRAIGRFLTVKDQNIAISGTIPTDSESTILFFKTSTGVTHSLPFPLRTDRFHQSPAFEALLAECEKIPDEQLDSNTTASTQVRLDKSKRVWPFKRPFSLSFDIANHPIIDTIRSILFPKIYPGSYLYAVRDNLEIFLPGTRSNAWRSSPSQGYSGATRVATLILTLPMLYRGGASVVRNLHGSVERFYSPAQNSPGDTTLHWMAFVSDCEHEVEVVEQGCRLIISYGVYMKSFGPAGPIPNPLLNPNDQLLDALTPVLNLSRGKTLAICLTGQYSCDPTQILADSLVPILKGSDATVYHALKLFKLTPELRWTADGYIWPADKTVQYCRADAEEPRLPSVIRENLDYLYNAPNMAAKQIRQRRQSISHSSFESESTPSNSSGSFESSYSPRSRPAKYERAPHRMEMEPEIANGAMRLSNTKIVLLTSSKQKAAVGEINVGLRGDIIKMPVYPVVVFYVE